MERDDFETYAERMDRERRDHETIEQMARDTFDGWTVIDTTPDQFDPFTYQ